MRYQRASRDIIAEAFDGESIVLDLSCGKYFSFSDSGNSLWEALSQGADTDSISAACAKAPWGSALGGFVEDLVANKLLMQAEGPGIELSPELAARLMAAVEAPAVSVFDDMADLFLADPIHDVEEEAGWPVKKAEA
ncbi:hypothetical protein IZ6_29420 [Terrihabitans soli]|uniref:PqqD family protein n=1 Tax=Terrihabitans soli TaxID=708113 RepID=A0A6S6QWA6_9HYPH|nr:PqqD family protein [Terrihabitans soli]BCJ92207.1 hypothetical protein IZ6_29420 [Terrihabitans soli]